MTEDRAEETPEEAHDGAGDDSIFVDGTGENNRYSYDDDVVDAVTIIRDAGYAEEPKKYILEALRGQSGAVVEEFDPRGEKGPSEVNLTDQHRKHFQVRTRGEVFI